ncbi:hypothetical protein LTR16_011283 [Cryomyces antarcticus]|uniref:Uncharacterized protein n=1 Tax=Cryomyces antarcticus TaxID=329879 RepID=A0ABR0M3H5_9PEZI|nr:hypothetical protein LTR16_011283 [Cryomyces antarcticus]
MGMLSYIERLTRDCDSMRDFLCRGYGEVGCGQEAAALEATRLQKRNKNSTVTELAKRLSPLSLPASTATKKESFPCVPKNGQEIKDLDRESSPPPHVSSSNIAGNSPPPSRPAAHPPSARLY